jgi:hypothetical protein
MTSVLDELIAHYALLTFIPSSHNTVFILTSYGFCCVFLTFLDFMFINFTFLSLRSI